MKIVARMSEEIMGIVETLTHFWNLLFNIDAFMKQVRDRDGVGDNLATNSRKLRAKISRAFWIVLGTFIPTGAGCMLLGHVGVHIPHDILAVARAIAYFLILWGVLSPVGYGIRTIGGETLPEVVDEEWHRFLYWIAAIVLWSSYLIE